MVHSNSKYIENTAAVIQAKTQMLTPNDGDSGPVNKNQVPISELNKNRFSPFGCEIKSTITVKSLEMDVEDLSAFRW